MPKDTNLARKVNIEMILQGQKLTSELYLG